MTIPKAPNRDQRVTRGAHPADGPDALDARGLIGRLPRATGAVLLWLGASVGFAWYVGSFGSYNETYGTMAGVIVLMLWLFLSAFAILVGAELNAEAERQTRHDTTVGTPQPMGQRGANAADVDPDADTTA